MIILQIIAVIVIAPVIGGLLAGVSRVISAKMQRRKGPPLLQPFYDVIKLWQKQSKEIAPQISILVAFSLIFHVLTVTLFFIGSNLVLVVFALTLATVFFVMAGYASYSPYSFAGAERELLQAMSYEPMLLITAFGFYKALGTFHVSGVLTAQAPLIFQLPLIFMGLLVVLTVMLRKSPFDLSTSHHAHQELVKGITTEMTGKTLALVELSHWYESVLAMGFVYIFFVYASPFSHIWALAAVLVVYFIEIIIDNVFPRVRWQLVLKSCWIATFVLGGANLLLTGLLK